MPFLIFKLLINKYLCEKILKSFSIRKSVRANIVGIKMVYCRLVVKGAALKEAKKLDFFFFPDIPCPLGEYLYPVENQAMPITHAIHKADRLEEIKILFLRRPEGVGTREIAQLLRVSQRTARRYVLELSEKGRLPVYREGRVWKLVEGGQIDLRRIQLNLDEALALYLAARMLSAYSDKHNPHVVASLLKLAAALPEAIGAHIEHTAEAVSQRRLAPGYLNVLEGLTRAWAGQRRGRCMKREDAWMESRV